MQSNKQNDPRHDAQSGRQDSRQQNQQRDDDGQKSQASSANQHQTAQPGQQQRDTQSPSRDRQQVAGQAGEGHGKVQGEGDYESNRRYTESAKDFVESGKVDDAARNAQPQSQQEAADMRKAEQEGASHAKGGKSSTSSSDSMKPRQG